MQNDGDQDVIANMGAFFTGDFFKSAVFLNPHRNHTEPSELHRFIKIALVGVTANRQAIGARVAVTVTSPSLSEGGWFGMGSTMGTRTVHAVVSSGGSYGSSPVSTLHIGLGDAVAIRRIEITWPVTNQTAQVFEPEPTASPPVALDLDSSMRIVQGRLRPEVLALPTNDFEELAAEMVANPSGCSCSMHD